LCTGDDGDAVSALEAFAGRELDSAEKSCLIAQFSSQAILLGQGQFRKSDATRLLMRIKAAVKSSTKLKMKGDYLFDGLVPGAYGQGSTVVQYVVRGSELFCAKVGPKALIGREAAVARKVADKQSCPTVIPLIDSIDIKGDRLALIMPFYPLPLSQFAFGKPAEVAVVNVALCGIATIKAFSGELMCHGDIKPANMMFGQTGATVVFIDFGSSVPYGDSILATTPQYPLDCPAEGSLQFDLTCLASSVFHVKRGSMDGIVTRADLATALKDSTDCSLLIAAVLLSGRDIDEIWSIAVNLSARAFANDTAHLVDHVAVWPRPK
jgi:hypothetical protein